MSQGVRTRFAPSPTGVLHVGGVRTALFNYLFAKQSGGQFILRLEDTDRERFVAEGIEQIVEALNWLGLVPDEGFWISEGQHQNIDYIQSERHRRGLYQKYADELLVRGLAYYSYISIADYNRLKEDSIKAGKPFVYRKSMEAVQQTQQNQKPSADIPIRINIETVKSSLDKDGQTKGSVKWSDKVHGEFTDSLGGVEDFILIKSDGFPTYNFANVIDDHDMKISHVIRGDEFIASTGKHVMLYQLFGWQAPVFIHLPLISGTDGKKLSKRTGDTDVLEYTKKGYLPEALLNFLVLLGWNDGTEQELFSLDELIKKFKLEQINASPAVFDLKRLDWMNGHYIRAMSLQSLAKTAEAFWPAAAADASDKYKTSVLKLVQERLKFLAELPELTTFFFKEPSEKNLAVLYDNPPDKQLQKVDKAKYPSMVEATIDSLEQSDFTEADLKNRLNRLLQKLDTQPGVLFPLIRIGVSGAKSTPEITGTLIVLGKARSLKRLNRALKLLNS